MPFIEGDGIGPELVASARKVVDEAVKAAYKGSRQVVWWEIYAGEKGQKTYNTVLPHDTLNAIRFCKVALKGPLTTPVGGGFRSINVTIRQELDLYANIRPVKWIRGIPTNYKQPEKIDWVFFRENTEDVYAGIEWPYDSVEAKKLREFLEREFGVKIREDAGIGIKPISRYSTQRIMRKAVRYTIENGRKTVTIMHKGNIMKYTEGSFADWAYEVAKNEFREHCVTESEANEKYGGNVPEGKILVNDRIADNMMQQIITRPDSYDVVVAPNLNGDYITDEANALVGGIGVALGANVGDYMAVVEPIHGSAPKYAGKNIADPTSQIMAAAWLLNYIGWREASNLIEEAVKKAVSEKKVTQDLARYMEGVKPLTTTEFTNTVINNARKLNKAWES